jgi:hypothetical protein
MGAPWRMSRAERIFNNRPRKLYRKHIPDREAWFGAGFVAFVLLMTVWFFGQKDNFDPAERDISMQAMVAGSVVDGLYRTPLARWSDPAKAGQGGSAGPDLGIFPAAVLDGGWTPTTRAQEFDESNLYEKINGQAPQYVSYGFQRLHYLGLAAPGGAPELGIEFYDMGAFQNALGIFAEQRSPNATVEQAAGAHFYRTAVGAMGIHDRYYFKITGTDSTPDVQEKSAALAAAFGGMRLEAATTPLFFTVLTERLGVPFDAVEFRKEDVFQYAFAKDFWFGEAAPGGLRYYAHAAESPEAARTLYDLLLKNHLMDYTEAGRMEQGVVLKHKFLDEYLVMVLSHNLVIGVDAAPDQPQAAEALARLEGALAYGQES